MASIPNSQTWRQRYFTRWALPGWAAVLWKPVERLISWLGDIEFVASKVDDLSWAAVGSFVVDWGWGITIPIGLVGLYVAGRRSEKAEQPKLPGEPCSKLHTSPQQHEQLVWIDSLLRDEISEPQASLKVGKWTADWNNFNASRPYFKFTTTITSSSIHSAHILAPPTNLRIVWDGEEFTHSPRLEGERTDKRGVISVPAHSSIGFTIQQQLTSEEVEAIRKRSAKTSPSLVPLDMTGYPIPFELEPKSIGASATISGKLNIPKNIPLPFPREFAYPAYSVEREKSYVSRRGGSGKLYAHIVLREKNQHGLRLQLESTTVYMNGLRIGRAVASDFQTTDDGEFQRYHFDADFDGDDSLPEDMLEEVWWSPSRMSLLLSDGTRLQNSESVLYVPSPERFREPAG